VVLSLMIEECCCAGVEYLRCLGDVANTLRAAAFDAMIGVEGDAASMRFGRSFLALLMIFDFFVTNSSSRQSDVHYRGHHALRGFEGPALVRLVIEGAGAGAGAGAGSGAGSARPDVGDRLCFTLYTQADPSVKLYSFNCRRPAFVTDRVLLSATRTASHDPAGLAQQLARRYFLHAHNVCVGYSRLSPSLHCCVSSLKVLLCELLLQAAGVTDGSACGG
jgi:hypothetical protein